MNECKPLPPACPPNATPGRVPFVGAGPLPPRCPLPAPPPAPAPAPPPPPAGPAPVLLLIVPRCAVAEMCADLPPPTEECMGMKLAVAGGRVLWLTGLQGLTLVHVRAQLEHIRDAFVGHVG